MVYAQMFELHGLKRNIVLFLVLSHFEFIIPVIIYFLQSIAITKFDMPKMQKVARKINGF